MDGDFLMIPDEAIQALRLDDRADPEGALRHLRRTGQLRGIKVAGRWRYRASDVQGYLKTCEVSEIV